MGSCSTFSRNQHINPFPKTDKKIQYLGKHKLVKETFEIVLASVLQDMNTYKSIHLDPVIRPKRPNSGNHDKDMLAVEPSHKKHYFKDINRNLCVANALAANVDAMVCIIEWLDDADTIGRLLFVLGKFCRGIMSSVGHLALRGVGRMFSHTLLQFINLKSFHLKGHDSFSTKQPLKRRDGHITSAPLPPSLQSIVVEGDSGPPIEQLLGSDKRLALQHVQITVSPSYVTHNVSSIFVNAPNLCSVHLTNHKGRHPWCLSDLRHFVHILSESCPHLETLAFITRPPISDDGERNTIDFSLLSSLKALIFWARWSGNQSLKIVFPPNLELLSISVRLFCDNVAPNTKQLQQPNLKQMSLIDSISVKSWPPSFHLANFAPNLESISAPGFLPCLKTDIHPNLLMFPKLKSMDGSILYQHPECWSFVSNSEHSGGSGVPNMCVMNPPEKVRLSKHVLELCNMPSFKSFVFEEENLVQCVPRRTLWEATDIEFVQCSRDDWQNLVALQMSPPLDHYLMATNLVRLELKNFDLSAHLKPIMKEGALIGFDHSLRQDFLHLRALRKLGIETRSRVTISAIMTLRLVKEMVRCISVIKHLSKLSFWHSNDVLQNDYEELCDSPVEVVREACPSFASLLQAQNNLTTLYMQYPMVDIDEPGLNYRRDHHLLYLNIFIWRGGALGFDEDNYACLRFNLVPHILRNEPHIHVNIIQPNWTMECPISSKPIICTNMMPKSVSYRNLMTPDAGSEKYRIYALNIDEKEKCMLPTTPK